MACDPWPIIRWGMRIGIARSITLKIKWQDNFMDLCKRRLVAASEKVKRTQSEQVRRHPTLQQRWRSLASTKTSFVKRDVKYFNRRACLYRT